MMMHLAENYPSTRLFAMHILLNRRSIKFLILTVLFFQTGFLRAQETILANRFILEKSQIQTLFSKEAGEKAGLQITRPDRLEWVLEGKVVSHLNHGAQSGVMRLDLESGGKTYRLLMNRKPLDGSVVYRINLIQEGGKPAFHLKGEDPDHFFLEETELANIVEP